MKRDAFTNRSLTDNVYPFRKRSRFEFVNGGWFFATREGLIGPFSTREEAEIETMMFVRRITQVDLFGLDQEHRISSQA